MHLLFRLLCSWLLCSVSLCMSLGTYFIMVEYESPYQERRKPFKYYLLSWRGFGWFCVSVGSLIAAGWGYHLFLPDMTSKIYGLLPIGVTGMTIYMLLRE